MFLRLLPPLTALALLTTPLHAADSPEVFVRHLYTRQYRDDGPGVSTYRPEGAAFYTAELLDEFAKDSELAHGEVGAIGQDPVCDCQDWGKVRIRHLSVTPAKGGRVMARVDLLNLGSAYTMTLTLTPTPAGWRIADIGTKDTPSLLAYIKNANAHPVTDPPPKP